ncbi:hypothetical protein FI667_g12700, partial [Globisporangium splendens]
MALTNCRDADDNEAGADNLDRPNDAYRYDALVAAIATVVDHHALVHDRRGGHSPDSSHVELRGDDILTVAAGTSHRRDAGNAIAIASFGVGATQSVEHIQSAPDPHSRGAVQRRG